MATKKQCEFYLLRYMPDVVKGEFVNIGVVLLEAGAGEARFTDVRLTHDWRRVRCLDPDVDIELLEALERDLRSKLQSRVPEIINYKGPMSRREWLLDQIETGWAGALQMAPVMGVLTNLPEAEIGVLANRYLESQSREKAERIVRGRQAIYLAMRGAFEEAGVWTLMQKDIAAAEFTPAGRSVQSGLRVPAEWRAAYVSCFVARGAARLGAGQRSQGAGVQLRRDARGADSEAAG